MSDSPGLRRLDAEGVNQRASELDGQPYEVIPAEEGSQVEPGGSAVADHAAALESSTSDADLYPAEQEGSQAIGGSVEDRAVLREEETP